MLGWKNRPRTDYIIVHCSKTHPDQKDTEGNPVDFRYLDRKHREAGTFECGYHWVINRDGAAVTFRPGNAIGNHCPGSNGVSISICMIGGVDASGAPTSNYTKAQWRSLRNLVAALTTQYPEAEVVGHRDLSPTEETCPSFDVRHWVADNKYQHKQTTETPNEEHQPSGPGPQTPPVG